MKLLTESFIYAHTHIYIYINMQISHTLSGYNDRLRWLCKDIDCYWSQNGGREKEKTSKLRFDMRADRQEVSIVWKVFN